MCDESGCKITAASKSDVSVSKAIRLAEKLSFNMNLDSTHNRLKFEIYAAQNYASSQGHET